MCAPWYLIDEWNSCHEAVDIQRLSRIEMPWGFESDVLVAHHFRGLTIWWAWVLGCLTMVFFLGPNTRCWQRFQVYRMLYLFFQLFYVLIELEGVMCYCWCWKCKLRCSKKLLWSRKSLDEVIDSYKYCIHNTIWSDMVMGDPYFLIKPWHLTNVSKLSASAGYLFLQMHPYKFYTNRFFEGLCWNLGRKAMEWWSSACQHIHVYYYIYICIHIFSWLRVSSTIHSKIT